MAARHHLLGRRRVWLVPAWIATVALVAWPRFGGWWPTTASGVGHVLAGIALAIVVAAAWRRDELDTDVLAVAGAAVLATWTWVPCVGRELGDVLNGARVDPWAELVPTVTYLVGLFLPLILIVALGVAVPRIGEAMTVQHARSVGLAVLFTVGALVAITLFDDLAGELARRSSF